MAEIELRMMGGLGNQLYQYSAARYVQSETGADKIIIDTSGYDSYKIRNLELNSILNNERVRFTKTKNIKNSIIRESFHVLQKIYNMLTGKHIPMKIFKFGSGRYILSSVAFDENRICEKWDDNIYMYGYFVNAHTSLTMKKELKKEIISPTNGSEVYKKLKEEIKQGPAIGISIRCGSDYEDNGWPICSKLFYLEALKKLIDIYPEYKIYVFADDLELVVQQNWFDGYDVTYIKDVNVCESFDLLRQCSAYVCSNSSFSWWGAFLSVCDNPIIYNPSKVFGGNSEYDDQQTFYSDLILLDYQTGEVIKNAN